VSELPVQGLPAQKIGADDLLSISVYQSPELSRTVRVGPDGSFELPLVKQRIRAEGLLPRELEKKTAEVLKAEEILVDPVVSVAVLEYRSRPISVAGAVRRPVTFQASGGVTLMEALTRAEGLTPEAGNDILVTRAKKTEDGGYQKFTQRIAVKALMDAADPTLNVALSGGEEISVPEVGRVYVAGNVKHPGAFPLKDSSGMTFLKLVALAEGLSPFPAKDAYIYRREAKSSSKQEITVELKKIMERKAADVALEPDDIVYIPDNKGKRMTVGALEKLVGFGSATASGVLIWGR
jgi:polysaccharide export outer membrane protein